MNIIDEDIRLNTKPSDNKHRPPIDKKTMIRNKSVPPKKAISKSTNIPNNLIQERILSPKTNYNFINEFMNKSINQIDSVATSEKSRKSSFAESGQSSVHLYLQRRHTEAQQKLLRLKSDKIKRESDEIKDRPTISKNSQKIANKLSSNQNVVQRLTNKRNDTKKQEEISKIFDLNDKSQSKPTINPTSEKLQRTIDDLYYWQEKLNDKKNKQIEEKNKEVIYKPNVLRNSEEILREKNPRYLETRVEDRLLERGQQTKYKIEENKEQLSKRNTNSKRKRVKSNEKIIVSPPDNDEIKNIYEDRPIDLTYIKQSECKIIPKSIETQNIIKTTKSQSKLNVAKTPSVHSQSREYIQDTPKDYNELSEVRKHLSSYYTTKHKQNKDNIFKEYMTTNEPTKKSTTDVIKQQAIDEKKIKPMRSNTIEKTNPLKEKSNKSEIIPEPINKYDLIDEFISYAKSPTINEPIISRGGYNFRDLRTTPMKTIEHEPYIDNTNYTPKHIKNEQAKPSEEKEPYYINTNAYNRKPIIDTGNKRLNDLNSIKDLVSSIDNILKYENVQNKDFSQINTQKNITKKEQLDERYKDGLYVVNDDKDYYNYLNNNNQSVLRTNNLFNNLKDNKNISPIITRKEIPDTSYLNNHSFRKIIDHDDEPSHIIKSTNYDSEYNRIKTRIENRNDKLKLDDKSRDFAMNKMNDYLSPVNKDQGNNPVGKLY